MAEEKLNEPQEAPEMAESSAETAPAPSVMARVLACLHAAWDYVKSPLHAAWVGLGVLLLVAISSPLWLKPIAPYSYVTTLKLARSTPSHLPLPHTLDNWIQDRFSVFPPENNFLAQGRQFISAQKETEKTATLSLIILELGRQAVSTDAAIQTLPPQVALAFFSSTWGLQEKINQAISKSHQVLLMLPMEPLQYPENDPGPDPLLTGLAPADLLKRLQTHMGTLKNLYGVTPFMGERFTPSLPDMEALFKALHPLHMVYVENATSVRSVAREAAQKTGLSLLQSTKRLRSETSPQDFTQQLTEAEKLAHQQGHITLQVSVNAMVIPLLENWLATLPQKHITLVPLQAKAAS